MLISVFKSAQLKVLFDVTIYAPRFDGFLVLMCFSTNKIILSIRLLKTFFARHSLMDFKSYIDKYFTIILMATVSSLYSLPVNAGMNCSSFLSSANSSEKDSLLSKQISELNNLITKIRKKTIVLGKNRFKIADLVFQRYFEANSEVYVLNMISPKGERIGYIIIDREGPTQVTGAENGVYINLFNRRKGLGKLLYLMAAHDLYLRSGLVLQKSNNTSQDADFVWRALFKNGFVEIKKNKIIFNEAFLKSEQVKDWFRSNLNEIIDEPAA